MEDCIHRQSPGWMTFLRLRLRFFLQIVAGGRESFRILFKTANATRWGTFGDDVSQRKLFLQCMHGMAVLRLVVKPCVVKISKDCAAPQRGQRGMRVVRTSGSMLECDAQGSAENYCGVVFINFFCTDTTWVIQAI